MVYLTEREIQRMKEADERARKAEQLGAEDFDLPWRPKKGRKLTAEQIASRLANLQRGRLESKQRKIAEAMSRENREVKVYPIGHKLTSRHWEVTFRHLLGYTAVDIAAQCGYKHEETVIGILRRPDVSDIIHQVRTQQMERIIRGEYGPIAMAQEAAPRLMQRNIEIAETADPKIAQKSIMDVLDRAGHVAPKEVRHHHLVEVLQQFTDAELDAFRKRGELPERFGQLQLTGPITDDGADE